MKKFKKEFKTYVFIFNVSYDNRKWQYVFFYSRKTQEKIYLIFGIR